MSLFDFFFPEQAQATHLRSIAQSARSQQLQSRSREVAAFHAQRRVNFQKGGMNEQVARLEDELAQSALVIESLISLLEEKQVFSRQDLQLRVTQIDSADGVVDGKMTSTVSLPAPKPLRPKWGSRE